MCCGRVKLTKRKKKRQLPYYYMYCIYNVHVLPLRVLQYKCYYYYQHDYDVLRLSTPLPTNELSCSIHSISTCCCTTLLITPGALKVPGKRAFSRTFRKVFKMIIMGCQFNQPFTFNRSTRTDIVLGCEYELIIQNPLGFII